MIRQTPTQMILEKQHMVKIEISCSKLKISITMLIFEEKKSRLIVLLQIAKVVYIVLLKSEKTL